jgi:hypothetical protein
MMRMGRWGYGPELAFAPARAMGARDGEFTPSGRVKAVGRWVRRAPWGLFARRAEGAAGDAGGVRGVGGEQDVALRARTYDAGRVRELVTVVARLNPQRAPRAEHLAHLARLLRAEINGLLPYVEAYYQHLPPGHIWRPRLLVTLDRTCRLRDAQVSAGPAAVSQLRALGRALDELLRVAELYRRTRPEE